MVVGHADLAEKVGLLVGRDDHGNIVARVQDKIALWNKGLPRATHHAQQRSAAQYRADLAHGHPLQPRAVRDADIQQFDTSLGKGTHVDCGWKTDQARNDARGRQFRIDDHGQAKLVAHKADLFHMLRVAHTRDRVAAGRFAGNQAGKQIDLVVRGDGDEQVGVLHARLLEHMIAGAAAGHRSQVERVHQLGQPPLRQVDKRQVVPFGRKLLSQCRANLSAAYNDDAHGAPPIFCSCQETL